MICPAYGLTTVRTTAKSSSQVQVQASANNVPFRFLPCFLAVSLLIADVVRAQDTPNPTPAITLENVSPGVYRLGAVVIDKTARQVRFPAVVNQTEGPVEYLLVGTGGKTHESILRTDVSPLQVHTAMLLLGVQPFLDAARAGTARPRQPPAAIDADYLATAPLPAGIDVTLLVRWPATADAPPADHRAESLVDNADTRAPMADGFWLYNGSLIVEGRFQADLERSFVAVITDPDALLNNPRPGHNDETIWTAGTARLPQVGTAVEFVIQLPAVKP